MPPPLLRRRSSTTVTTIGRLLPDLAVELSSLLMEVGRVDLARLVGQLPIVAWCDCGATYCQTFFTVAPDAVRPDRPGEFLMLPRTKGTVCLELRDGRVAVIVIHDRPDLVPALARDVSVVALNHRAGPHGR